MKSRIRQYTVFPLVRSSKARARGVGAAASSRGEWLARWSGPAAPVVGNFCLPPGLPNLHPLEPHDMLRSCLLIGMLVTPANSEASIRIDVAAANRVSSPLFLSSPFHEL